MGDQIVLITGVVTGFFGRVYKARHRITGDFVVVKELKERYI